MRGSDVIAALAHAFPSAAKAAITLSLGRKLPFAIHTHWAVRRLLPELFPDGVLTTINGMAFKVPAIAAAYYREYEPATQKLIERCLQPGMVFIDVGANIGFFSVVAAQIVGNTGKVYAFEPSPRNIPLLRRNIEARGLSNVEIHEVALGETNCARKLQVTLDQLTDGFVAGPYSPVLYTQRVDQRRLDDIIQSRVDFVKIDVEGAELQVLQGMSGLIRKNSHISFVVEWGPAMMRAAGHSPEELPQFFKNLGFTKMQVIEHGNTYSVEEMLALFKADESGTRYANLFVQPKSPAQQ